jgi:hypothetical protein
VVGLTTIVAGTTKRSVPEDVMNDIINTYFATTMVRDHVDELVATAADARRAKEARSARRRNRARSKLGRG